jgi:hypothetical protein
LLQKQLFGVKGSWRYDATYHLQPDNDNDDEIISKASVNELTKQVSVYMSHHFRRKVFGQIFIQAFFTLFRPKDTNSGANRNYDF